ncbi:serine/threonine-protein kinase [Actinomadura barringtoniae]|uniref:serine/threonine-protein kinase n=1 Tax=Actinomadura barringtoniae TaxID=1427535 RepID=UPI0024420995|nr:serine/threonine-protein kinase [Actinomadura barringtoniae]
MSTTPRPGDPEVLGRYQVLGRLGRGGMGTVYLGRDDAGRRVAIKVINAELADDEAFHQRFRREVTAARKVRRFSTAAVLDARLDGEPLYVVTEFVDGPTLEQAVRDDGPLTGGALEGLAVNIATALGAIHGAGVVHRDLKPSNVMLSPTGPRVIDFGIARALDAEHGAGGPTRTGQFVGTPSYIAPELMRGGALTPAADVFSWGCVVTFAGTGHSPFNGRNVPEIINRVVNDPPDIDDLDPSLRAIVERALAKDPAQRPDTAELLRELTGQHHPVPPPRPAPSILEPSPPFLPPPPGTAPPSPPVTALPTATHESLPRRSPWLRRGAAITALGIALAGAGYGISQMDNGSRSNATPSDKPPKTAQALVKDDFGKPSSGWPNGSSDCGGYQDGAYRMTILAKDGTETCTATNRQTLGADHVLVGVKVKLANGPADAPWEAGLFLNKDSRDNGYAVVLRQDGQVRLVKVVGNSFTEMASVKAPDAKPNDDNRLQAELDMRTATPRITVWVNDRKAFTRSDAAGPLPSGPAALVLYDAGSAQQVSAEFTDFSVGTVR